VLAIDPADYKRIGHMQYPDSLPLLDKEVVITFDDGPIPPYSNQILDILASQCVKVTYFLVGEMARAYPAIVRHEYEAGHTIGTHSEHHPLHFGELAPERMRSEIDVGISDVAAALGDTKYMAPFFRLPGLDRSNRVEEELAARHLIVFSSDTLADDWRRIGPEQIRSLALKRLQALGKGILLLHDIHANRGRAARHSQGPQGQRLPHRAGGAVGVLRDRHGEKAAGARADTGLGHARGAQGRRRPQRRGKAGLAAADPGESRS
jgi:peptidoglycan/xylan/chitin deacetylase (PgdA/CDA1 family)